MPFKTEQLLAPVADSTAAVVHDTDTAEAFGAATDADAANVAGEKFADMALPVSLLQSILAAGYQSPTPIQAQVIPLMLAGRSVLAQSQTGSGKTAAFALPVIAQTKTDSRQLQTLILTPTRELCIQVSKSLHTYAAKTKGFSVTAIYGGQSYQPQLQQLRSGVHCVVGTPGRVIDHVKRGTLDLSSVNCLILDEADEMLQMGFIDDIKFVLERLPTKRQTALFSATMPKPIVKIADRYMDDAVQVSIKQSTLTVGSVRQRAVLVNRYQKLEVLIRFLEFEEIDGAIVFCKTREATMDIASRLVDRGFSALALNGDMQQRIREKTIDSLKSGKLDVLVATDVAARGLDVSRITHVFNLDIPIDAETYTHRIGRTGRAGRKGEAILFFTPAERRRLQMIERVTRQEVEIVPVPGTREINLKRMERFSERMVAASSGEKYEQFLSIVRQHADKTGQTFEEISAALATMLHGDRQFFASDIKSVKSPRQTVPAENGNRRPFRVNERSQSNDHARYRIEVGREHGVTPSNIVGAVANEAGISGKAIGAIRIQDDFTVIELPSDISKNALQKLQKTWVAGRQLNIRADGAAVAPSARAKANDGEKPFKAKKKFGPKSEMAAGTKGKNDKKKLGKRKVRKFAASGSEGKKIRGETVS